MEDILKDITPRDYQKNIAKTCIDKNTLVVLPTGLGKTLIALIVAIDRLKKYPDKKILILAPTKPLVEQHKISFLEKLPEDYAKIELFTGTVKAEKRKTIWETANIIFSTPQCIANDLKKGLYTLRDVSLLVEDEAHRCVRNYDYAYIAKRYNLEAEFPRAIGLTASPGSDVDKIKEIGINLHIKDIELRTRESWDVKDYLQELEFTKHELDLPAELVEMKSMMQIIYDTYIDDLRRREFLFGQDNKLALLQLQKKIGLQINQNIHSRESFIAMSACAQAIKLLHGIELISTQTVESFTKYIETLQKNGEKRESKGTTKLVNNSMFQKIRQNALACMQKGMEHPKVDEVNRIIRDEHLENKDNKSIIFTQFRETAEILSKNLNKIDGIKSKVFIGQAKKDGKGLSQKEQKKMIEEFRNREINILVATCIAEEGLDIPEVNSVVFYEPVSSAIRSIQRRGRTARLSKGKLIMLLTKGTKDEFANYASRAREKKMTAQIQKVKDILTERGTLRQPTDPQRKLF